MRNTEAVFWCVKDCSRLETSASMAAEYASSVEKQSIGAFLKTSRIGSSVLFAACKADSLYRMRRLPSCLYSASLVGQAVQARPESKWVTLKISLSWRENLGEGLQQLNVVLVGLNGRAHQTLILLA